MPSKRLWFGPRWRDNWDVSRFLMAAALVVPALACSKGELYDRVGDGSPAPESLELPTCLQELVASCAPTGMCASAPTNAGVMGDVCFASGVRVTFDLVTDTLGCGNSVTARVTRPDGSLCYVFHRYHDEAKTCADFVYVWYDANDRIIASATKSPGHSPDLTVVCLSTYNGTKRTCDVGTSVPSCCDIDSLGAASCGLDIPYGRCTPGDCP